MFDIIFTHTDFVVINKHPNVSVHKDDGETMLVAEVARALNVPSLYLVHRLDKMTSGILLLAKTSEAASCLAGMFARREMDKYYLAIGSKKPKKKQGLISGDMQRSRRSSWKLMPTHINPAITQFFSTAGEAGQRVFLCKPYTGKTHQIRVALKSVGAPIVGDPIYNSADEQADRGYLHAFALRFNYQGESIELVCDPRNYPHFGNAWHSDACAKAVELWASPWELEWPVLKTATDKNE